MLTVRKGSEGDIARIADWQMAMARETENLTLDRNTVERGVAHIVSNPEIGHYALVERHGCPLGCMMLLSEWSDWRCGRVLWIHSVYIEPAARRQGVFTALYRYARDLVASDPNLRGLRLYVDKRNRAAIETYEGLGMDGSHYALYEWMKP